MHIRRFSAQDSALYISLEAAFYADTDAVDHCIAPHHATRTFAALMEKSPLLDAFLAQDDSGEPLGFVLLALTWSNEAGGVAVWIEELLVLPAARGQGVGRALLAHVQQAYAHACRFRLEVTAQNTRASALYEQLGYVPLPYAQMVLDFPPVP